VGFVPWQVKRLKYFFINYLLSFKVWEGAPLLEGTPLGMRRRDERLRKRVRCWDYTRVRERHGIRA
jgi:hypothetical protein